MFRISTQIPTQIVRVTTVESRSVQHSTGIANSISGIEARWIVVQGFTPGDGQSRLTCLGVSSAHV
jgi:hypothetical protein